MRAFEILRRVIGPLTLIHEQAGPRLLGLARLGVFALWMVKAATGSPVAAGRDARGRCCGRWGY